MIETSSRLAGVARGRVMASTGGKSPRVRFVAIIPGGDSPIRRSVRNCILDGVKGVQDVFRYQPWREPTVVAGQAVAVELSVSWNCN